MFNLLKLELKRFHFSFKFLITLICNIVILGIVSLIFFAEKDSFGTDFESFSVLLQLALSIISITFMVFSGVLISSMITSEYKNKTIMLLYTYPISRKKLLLSKLLLIFLFTFFSMIFSAFFIFFVFYGILYLTNSLFFTLTVDIFSKIAIVALTLSLIHISLKNLLQCLRKYLLYLFLLHLTLHSI